LDGLTLWSRTKKVTIKQKIGTETHKRTKILSGRPTVVTPAMTLAMAHTTMVKLVFNDIFINQFYGSTIQGACIFSLILPMGFLHTSVTNEPKLNQGNSIM
jgi:hypothetical protein